MALPAAAIIKAAVYALSNEKTRKGVGWIIAAVFSPFILVIVLICGLASGTANHNNTALDRTFNGGAIPSTMPSEYRAYITEMRDCFDSLDDAVADVSGEYEWEDGELDIIRIKSVFYALNFGQAEPAPTDIDVGAFLDNFIRYETRTRPCSDSTHHDEDEDCEETYMVAIPIAGLPEIYANVGAHTGRTLTPEDMMNINEIYLRVSRGDFSPDSGVGALTGNPNNTHALIAELIAGDDTPSTGGNYVSPIPGDWRSIVSCEFGTGYAGHTGMDIAIPRGTEIRAVAAGTVLFTRASPSGYGTHVVINHGGGVVTLYAHCNRILVGEGQRVEQGQTIALSGSTGNSTGPHLHIEFIINGTPCNPRAYL